MTTTVAKMTTDELRQMIEATIEQKLHEWLVVPDAVLDQREPVHDRVLRPTHNVAADSTHEAFEVAVILPLPEYEQLLRYKRLIEFEKIARRIGEDVESLGLSEEELMEELEETKHEVFLEQYGQLG